MKIATITWSSELPLPVQAAKEVGLDIEAWSSSQFADPRDLEKCLESLKDAQTILLHPSSEACWDEIVPALDPKSLVISFGLDPSHWALSSGADTGHGCPGREYSSSCRSSCGGRFCLSCGACL
jgi:cobaltochelatase CobN